MSTKTNNVPLPTFETLFAKLEEAATAHPPKRVVNPSERLKLGYDLFDDDGGVIVPDDVVA